MRIIHMADTHLGYKQYNLDIREQDIYDAFNQAIDLALEERADVIIHSGDLFDSPRPPIKALYVLSEALKKIEGKIKFIAVLGEHDIPKRRGMIPHRLFKFPTLGINFQLEHMELDGVLFAGISNMRSKYSDHLKEALKKFDKLAEDYKSSVLILHQAFKKFLPFEGAYQLTLDDLPKKANYYALGHIHARQTEKFGNGMLAYAGSTEILNRDEITSWKTNGKGINLIDLNGEVHVESLNLDIRPQVNMKIDVDELNTILNELNYEKKPILHLEIFGESIDKASTYQKLQNLLENTVEAFRPTFKETSFKDLEIPKGPIDFQTIIKDYFQDEQKTFLAFRLYEALSTNNIEDAKDIAQNFLNMEDLNFDN